MNRTAPSISLEPYLSRLRHANNGSGSEIPVELLEETFLLVYLFMEGKKGPLPDRYDSLGVMWATRPAGTIRDSEVERVLNGLFSTAAQ
jgi:hypothetical protein